MVQRLSGAFSVPDASQLQAQSSVTTGASFDRQLFVLPAVAAVQQESAESQARAQLMSARAATRTGAQLINLVEIHSIPSISDSPVTPERAVTDVQPGNTVGTPPAFGPARIGTPQAVDRSDSGADNAGAGESVDDSHSAADQLIREIQDETIKAFSEERSVRPLGAASFSALLRRESAKLKSDPFAGAVPLVARAG